MKEQLRSPGLIVLLSLIFLPVHAPAEVQISLKNEASIIADECREETDRLICFKMGGSFEIDKHDVLSMKNVSIRQQPVYETSETDTAASGVSDNSVKPGGKNQGAPLEGKDQKPAAMFNSSDDSAQKRLSLQAERESLFRERQQVQEDIKKAPDWMPAKQFDELTRRNTELDTRIKRFNEEAGRLSDKKKQAVPDEKK
ncbi:MAG: hypothetical protein C0402_09405 [Thermodesulfovibrio sp.]|nr:hypothetical protein [Thermodesulfovibrio sp.]